MTDLLGFVTMCPLGLDQDPSIVKCYVLPTHARVGVLNTNFTQSIPAMERHIED
jgi:hypothetical protein